MQINYVKAAMMAAWILAVGALAYLSGTTSFRDWTLVAVLLVMPPAFMMWLRSEPSPTMSEAIRKVLR